MIIRGVFSMSIVNRLKHLFKGENEGKDIKTDVSNTSDDVEVTPGRTKGISISFDKKEDGSKELTFKKDIETLEGDTIEKETVVKFSKPDKVPSEEIVEETEADEEAEVLVEDGVESDESIVEESAEEVEETSEEVDADENEEKSNEDKKGDNMTLLTDKELLNDSNRDPDFTAEFIDAGIETVKHCFQCGTCSGSCPSGRRTPYKVRQIVRKCLLGLKEEVIADDALWMCTTCYTCQERCLRSVKIVESIK